MCPAAEVPSCPYRSILLAAATFRDSLSNVPMSRSVGKELSSRGVFMKKVGTRTEREKVMLVARRTSRRKAGMGTIIAVSIITNARTIHASLYFTLRLY